MENQSIRDNLIGNRYVIRKGQCAINGDIVSMSMKMPHRNIDCHHAIGHLDNQSFDSIILDKFDKAVGGTAEQRGWDFLKFPIWLFTKASRIPQDIDPRDPYPNIVTSTSHANSSAMIARTDADCHGNVVDGDQLQSDLDASPRTAAVYQHPISFALAQALSDLDELLAKESNFFNDYHAACMTIEADKHSSDDFFFTAQTDSAREIMKRIDPSLNEHYSSVTVHGPRLLTTVPHAVAISELSQRQFKKFSFTANVFILEKLRQRQLIMFSSLAREVATVFAIGLDFAHGLLCRILPASNIIGVDKCAFGHAKEINADGRVVLDKEMRLTDVFLGEEKIYGKVLDSKRILAQGAEVDDVCLVIERKAALHITEVRQKSPNTDLEDSGFRVVQDAGQLIVGYSNEAHLIRRISILSDEKLKEAATKASSAQRAIRHISKFCDFSVNKNIAAKEAGSISASPRAYRSHGRREKDQYLFKRKGHLITPGVSSHALRTAMVSGMLEKSTEAKVRKVMQSFHALMWTKIVRDAIARVYEEKIRKSSDQSGGNVTVRVTTDSDVTSYELHSDTVLFGRLEVVEVAAVIRAGMALGMKMERPAGTVIMEGNGKDRMLLAVEDDIMKLVADGEFGLQASLPVQEDHEDDNGENVSDENELNIARE